MLTTQIGLFDSNEPARCSPMIGISQNKIRRNQGVVMAEKITRTVLAILQRPKLDSCSAIPRIFAPRFDPVGRRLESALEIISDH